MSKAFKTIEFQVVILAGGPGSRLYPLTSKIPKPLLPIVNRPLLSYQLELLERVGFSNVIVIVQEESVERVKDEIEKGERPWNIAIRWHTLPDFMGTAEALLHLKNEIETDFIVMSGDLIADEKFLHHMADIHRTHDATVTVLLKKRKSEKDDKKKKKNKSKIVNEFGLMDYIGLAKEDEKVEAYRLLYFQAAADIEHTMNLHKNLLHKYPDITIHTDLDDAHFYIFAHHVLELLTEQEDEIISIKGDLIPYVVKKQFSKRFLDPDSPSHNPLEDAYGMSLSDSKMQIGELRCLGYITSDYCTRANTSVSYLQSNRELTTPASIYKPWEPYQAGRKRNFISSSAVVSEKTQVGVQCVVGDGTKISDRCSIKQSVMGKHCFIGEGAKVINSVIMNHVTICAGAQIHNSIVCSEAYVGAKSTVKDSQIGTSERLPDKSDVKSESVCREDELLSD